MISIIPDAFQYFAYFWLKFRMLNIMERKHPISPIMVMAILFALPGLANAQAQKVIKEKEEKKIAYEDLPKAVQEKFEASEYANADQKTVEKVQSERQGTLYELEVKMKDQKRARVLYYKKNGELFRSQKAETEGAHHHHKEEEEEEEADED